MYAFRIYINYLFLNFFIKIKKKLSEKLDKFLFFCKKNYNSLLMMH